MRLLIDADEIGRLAETFRGVSMNLLNAAQTVRSDAWVAELSPQDVKVRGAAEVTSRVATKYEDHAAQLDTQAKELKQVESIVRGDHGEPGALAAIPITSWQVSTTQIAPLPNIVTVPTPLPSNLTQMMTPIDPASVMPNAASSMQAGLNWTAPVTSTVVSVQQAIAELAPPKKKKGLFGRIFSAIGNFFKNLWGKIKSIAKSLWTTLQNTLKKVWDALKHMSFKKLLLLAGGLALQFIPGLGQVVAGALFNGASAIFGAVNAARVITIANAAYRTFNFGKSVVNVVKHGIHGLTDVLGLVGGATSVLHGVGQLGGRVAAFAERAATSIEHVRTTIGDAANGVLKSVSTALGSVAERAVDFISGLIPNSGPLADVFRVVGRSAQTVIDWVKGAVNGVGAVIRDAKKWVNKTAEQIQAKFDSVIQGLRSSIGQQNPAMGDYVKKVLENAVNKGLLVVTSTWDELRSIIKDGIEQGLKIVAPVQVLLSGGIASATNRFVSSTIDGRIRSAVLNSQFWTGKSAATDALAARLTPTDEWTNPDPSMIDSIHDGVSNPIASNSIDVQTTPEDTAGMTPVAVEESGSIVEETTAAVGGQTTVVPSPEHTTPASDSTTALSENMNVVIPTGPLAAAWSGQEVGSHSSTVKGLLSLVDPISGYSSATSQFLRAA